MNEIIHSFDDDGKPTHIQLTYIHDKSIYMQVFGQKTQLVKLTLNQLSQIKDAITFMEKKLSQTRSDLNDEVDNS
tara:strand:+ start:280 stop:504 length:225 start_codon:yes stop_codon:yes gene_type:complete